MDYTLNKPELWIFKLLPIKRPKSTSGIYTRTYRNSASTLSTDSPSTELYILLCKACEMCEIVRLLSELWHPFFSLANHAGVPGDADWGFEMEAEMMEGRQTGELAAFRSIADWSSSAWALFPFSSSTLWLRCAIIPSFFYSHIHICVRTQTVPCARTHTHMKRR